MRKRYRWDKEKKCLVECGDNYSHERRALDAPISTDRFMENSCTQDGVDIGSRRKRRDYMRAAGVADFDDYRGVRADAEKRREAQERGQFDNRARQDDIGRAIYQLEQKQRRR